LSDQESSHKVCYLVELLAEDLLLERADHEPRDGVHVAVVVVRRQLRLHERDINNN